MATKYSFDVLDAETHDWTSIALFADIVPEGVLVDAALAIWNDIEGAADFAIVDMDTGEILWNAADAQEYECEEPDYDECGFNPYMGCYDYDC